MNFSKRFLITLAILAILLLIAFFVFNSKFVVKAQNQVKIFPVSYSLESSGEVIWQNPQNAFNQDLPDNASFADFNEENSASIQGKVREQTSTTTIPEETTTTTLPQEESITTTTTILEETTTTVLEEVTTTTTTTIPPEATTTTTLPPAETTTTTIPQETTTTTGPISWLKKIFGFLIPKVNAEEEKQTLNSASLIFENFSLPEGFDLNEIQNVQLRISLAGKGQEGDKVIISYFYSASAEASADKQWQNLEELDLSSEISNNTNGGYFLYALPIFENPEDLQNLKIKFTYYSTSIIPDFKLSPVYLDSVWLDLEYGEVIKIESKIGKHDWKMSEEPEFDFFEGDNRFLSYLKSLIGRGNLEASLITPDNQETQEGIIIQGNKIKIAQIKKFGFRPGLYKLRIKRDDQIIIQEFTWGVLAININKSIYLPNETAYLQMAVLRDDGHTICDASLKLEITNSKSQITILSTADGTIKYSGKCGPDNVTDVPDYFAYYQVGEPGTYQMKLTNLDNGYEILDSFEVRDSVPFEIERIGATRINPFLSNYVMTIKIKANQDYNGEIIENVPESFTITPDYRFQILNSKIIWSVDLKTGETYELKYQFDAPNISPYIYLLGPLQIGEFKEIRQWQIAADQTNIYLLWAGSGGSCSDAGAPPSGWTVVSSGAFTAIFPRGNSSYTANNGSMGSATHTHTASGGSTASSATITANISGSDNNALYTHTHTVSVSTVTTANSLPLYKDLCVITPSAGGIPSGDTAIPQNAIAIFDTTVPSGWSDYSATFGTYYLRGNTTPGGTGGSNTHANPGHTVSGTLVQAGGTIKDTTGTGALGSLGTHTHTFSLNSTDTPSIEPLSQNIILGQKTVSAGPIPGDMITIFDGDPGTGWDIKSDNGDDFYQKYLKVTGSYANNSSGATTHTHNQISDNSNSYTATEVTGTETGTLITSHTHPMTINLAVGTNTNLPPYTDVIIAKYLSAPTVGSVTLTDSDGENIDLNEGTTKQVWVTALVTDANGCSTISSVIGKIFRNASENPDLCLAQDDNNCYYNISCLIDASVNDCTGESDNDAQYKCMIDMQFHADPTDTGSPWDSEHWDGWMKATDSGSQSGTNQTTGIVEVITLRALNIATTTINYGTLDPGQNTTSTNQQITVTNTGNAAIGVRLYGIDMTWSGNTIDTANQEYSLSLFTYGAGNDLKESPSYDDVDAVLPKPTESPSNSSDIFYWGLGVSSSTPSGGPYQGTNTFEAIAETGEWVLNETNCNALSGWHWYTTNGRSACWSKTLADTVSWNKGVGDDTRITGSYTCTSLVTYDLQTRMTAAAAYEWYKITSEINAVTITPSHNGLAGYAYISALAISDCIDGTKDLTDCGGSCTDWSTTNTWLRTWAGASGKSALPYLATDAGTNQTDNDYWDACTQHSGQDTPLNSTNNFYLNRIVSDDGDTNYSWIAACGRSDGNSWDTSARKLGYGSCSGQFYFDTSGTDNRISFRSVVRP